MSNAFWNKPYVPEERQYNCEFCGGILRAPTNTELMMKVKEHMIATKHLVGTGLEVREL